MSEGCSGNTTISPGDRTRNDTSRDAGPIKGSIKGLNLWDEPSIDDKSLACLLETSKNTFRRVHFSRMQYVSLCSKSTSNLKKPNSAATSIGCFDNSTLKIGHKLLGHFIIDPPRPWW